MSIASEITRLQGAKSNILDAIAAKGVSVPSGAKLADCPELISLISGGGGFEADNVVNIVPINKIVVVDANGYIGFDLTKLFNYPNGGNYYYSFAILSKNDDFSQFSLGRVSIYTPEGNVIGGRNYDTVTIGGVTWMAENLDFKFSGLFLANRRSSLAITGEPIANYYSYDESTYGVNGNKYGLLYDYNSIIYLKNNKELLIPGWHIPTTAEWKKLFNDVGGESVAGLKLKSTSGWTSGNGDGSYAFFATPSGYSSNTSSGAKVGTRGYYWNDSEYIDNSDYKPRFDNDSSGISTYSFTKNDRYAIRLVKDSA